MIELPDFGALKIIQSTGEARKKQYESLDQLTIIVPARPSSSIFRSVPQGTQLRKLYAQDRSKRDTQVSTRMNNTRATAVTLATFPGGDAFSTLTWARKLVGESLKQRPAKMGVMAVGLDPSARRSAIEALVAAAEAAAFRMPAFKREKEPNRLRTVQILAAEPRLDLREARAQAFGNNIARWLTALPPNKLTAAAYRAAATELARAHSFQSEFFGEKELTKLGAGAFLAVAQGNADRDAGILRLKYRPSRKAEPELALVGKGITFDTGGTNLKPFKGMLDMHMDMQGSAVALGTGIALAQLGAPFAFDVWLAISENRLSARAYKSQDVVRALNGTTIQTIHTDAEGRMVLADTLALAARERPKLIIDYATLTGSCVAALTNRYSGVFSNRSEINEILVQAGRNSGERVWPFPMDDDFQDPLKSSAADIKQCAVENDGDHILAARFLTQFVPKSIPWIHLDLSAGQRKEGLAHIPTEVTGFGVRYSLELLRRKDELVA